MKGLLILLLLVTSSASATDLIYCGASQVVVIDPEKPERRKWSWQASDSPSIPATMQQRFRSTDECKPYAGGLLLITSSSGGVALIERESKRCRFLTQASNAHSACLLPRNQIAVAASFGGDELRIYDLGDKRRPAPAIQRIPLVGAHGCVWDAKRNCLWALGDVDFLRLSSDSSGKWSVKERWDLPARGGHDLSPRDEVNLYITSGKVLLFDRDTKKFTVHKSVGDQARVKSIDRDPKTGAVVYHQGTRTTWWSDMIRFIDRKPIRLKNARLYKVRWNLPIPAPVP